MLASLSVLFSASGSAGTCNTFLTKIRIRSITRPLSSSLSIESYQSLKKKSPGYRKFSVYEPVALQELTHNLFVWGKKERKKKKKREREISSKPIITNDAQTPEVACFTSVLKYFHNF